MALKTSQRRTTPPSRPPGAEKDELELSIVMPCLNEAETLAIVVDKAKAYLTRAGVRGEIIVADNGSTDGSRQIAEEHGARVVPVPLRGYGAALLEGFRQARGKYIVMADSDDSYDFSDLTPFLEKLREGFELVMGNRMSGGIQPGAMPALHRYLGNPVLSWIGRVLFRTPIRDFHCGIRGLRRDSILKLGLASPGMEFASEMVVKATLFKMSITQVDTKLFPDGRSRPPHLRSWRDGWRHLRLLFLYNPRWLFEYPGFALIIPGTIVTAWLLPHRRTLGNIVLDVHTLLYAAFAIILGVQCVVFGVLTAVYTITHGIVPNDEKIRRLFHPLRLEFGILLGFAVLLGGFLESVFALYFWKQQGFGTLNYRDALRVIIPSVLFMTVGCQIIFTSFFLGVLQLGENKK